MIFVPNRTNIWDTFLLTVCILKPFCKLSFINFLLQTPLQTTTMQPYNSPIAYFSNSLSSNSSTSSFISININRVRDLNINNLPHTTIFNIQCFIKSAFVNSKTQHISWSAHPNICHFNGFFYIGVFFLFGR